MIKNDNIKITTNDLCVFYDEKQALFDVNISINEKETTALIGPSGCGKSTLLRCFNRMNDTIENCVVKGNINIDNANVNNPEIDVVQLRTKIGMVFQKPNPFPKSIFDNVAYGPKIHGMAKNKLELEEIVEKSLKQAGLWSEVKDRLSQPGTVYQEDNNSGFV